MRMTKNILFIMAGLTFLTPVCVSSQEPVSALGQPTATEEPISQEASELDLLLENLEASSEALEEEATQSNAKADDKNVLSPLDVIYGLSPSEVMAINPMDELILEEGFTATLRVIDRRINRHVDYELKPLEVMNHHDMLLIQVVSCLPKYNDIAGNDSAYIVASNNAGESIYEGWIFAGTTSASTLEHPSYSVLLKNCG